MARDARKALLDHGIKSIKAVLCDLDAWLGSLMQRNLIGCWDPFFMSFGPFDELGPVVIGDGEAVQIHLSREEFGAVTGGRSMSGMWTLLWTWRRLGGFRGFGSL